MANPFPFEDQDAPITVAELEEIYGWPAFDPHDDPGDAWDSAATGAAFLLSRLLFAGVIATGFVVGAGVAWLITRRWPRG